MIRNRGDFVRQISLEQALEIYDIRGALFGLAGRIVWQKMTDALLAQLARLVRGIRTAAGYFALYYPLDLQFHQTIVAVTGRKALIDEYSRLVKKMHLFRAKGLVNGSFLAVSNREHGEMLNALASGDPERAHAAHLRHVERAKQRLLASMAEEQSAVDAETPRKAGT